jgi:hypothetical protein
MSRRNVDAVALKPTEHDITRATDLDLAVVVDYEGREHLPPADLLTSLAREREVVVTTPVRADGFDPLGEDDLAREWVPGDVRRAVVAGHPAYLAEEERSRAVAPRLGAAVERHPDAWVGTEGVERVALATGGAQYELLDRSTDRAVRALRAAGFDGEVVLYAPTVATDDDDAVLDAVGEYVARRRPVAEALPEGASTDATAGGRAREVLSAAARDFALVGTPVDVRDRVERLRNAGVDTVVAYPARGLDPFREAMEP